MKYQSQFIPTDFGTVQNLLGMYRQDMQQRDAQFDSASMASAQAMAELGAIPTFDIKGRQAMLDNLNKSIDEALARKGGDYGAAAKDLYRIIAKERSNPWLQYNSQQQEAAKLAQQLGADADNLIIGDPRAVDYNKWQSSVAQGQDPFNVKALSKSRIYNQVKDMASNYSKLLADDPKFASTLGGQYFKLFKQYGVTPAGFEEFITSGPGQMIMQSVIKSNPELQGANLETVKEVVKQGLTNAIGSSDMQYLQDQNFMSNYQRARLAGDSQTNSINNVSSTGYGLVPESLNDYGTEIFRELGDNLAKKTAEEFGIPGVESFEDLKKLATAQKRVDMDSKTFNRVSVDSGISYRVPKSEYYEKANKALEKIESMRKNNAEGTALPTYGILSTGLANGKNINEVKNLQSYLDQIANINFREDLKPVTSKDKKSLEKIDGDFTITEFSPNFNKDKAGLIFYLQGKDKDGKIMKSRVYIDPNNINTESHFVDYLSQLNPMIGIEYTYAKQGQDYLDKLARDYLSNPNVPMSTKETIVNFIESKSK